MINKTTNASIITAQPYNKLRVVKGAIRLTSFKGYEFRRHDRKRFTESFDPRGRPRFAIGAQPNKLRRLNPER
jgi:hypothetical protein